MSDLPDPTTPEGRNEIQRRIVKRRKEAEEIRRRAKEGLEEEPCGALTNPSEIDLFRDRKTED